MAEIQEVPVNVAQVKKDLIDPRTIAKSRDPEGRRTAVTSAWQSRGEARNVESTIQEKEVGIQALDEQYDSLREKKFGAKVRLNERQSQTLVKLKSKLRLGDAQVDATRQEIQNYDDQGNQVLEQHDQTRQELSQLKEREGEIPNPQEVLKAYYEKIQTLPLTNKEKREFLTPEILASLSTNEYIALWRRLNPYFLSHVTRQGFRDHNSMMYHSGGMQEFHRGFTNILEDGKQLRPPLTVRELPRRDEATVRAKLDEFILQAETEEEARQRLTDFLNFTLAEAPKYPDSTAVHFMTETVGDSYYGGETGNEVFFIYPADVLASQHNFAFNGWEKDFTKVQSEMKWNDVFVWPNNHEDPGIQVDAGIVFLPEKAQVDPETGSRYASEVRVVNGKETRVMVEDQELTQRFIEWGSSIDNNPVVKGAYDFYQNNRGDDYQYQSCIRTIATELQKVGFDTHASLNLGQRVLGDMYWKLEFTPELLNHIIREVGAQWKIAENIISSKEYWEAYFAKNPDQQPQHIVYYDGYPHSAVYEFQRKNNIGRADTAPAEGSLLGFQDHFVNDLKSDPRVYKGYDELKDIGDRLITERYQKTE